jgi:large subunit ribosomal protein L25
MEQKTLSGTVRKELRKKPARRLRKEGKIPAIIYGHTGSHAITVDEHEFNTKFHTVSENTIITLSTEDGSYDVLVKDFQENTLTGRILHIDFYEIERGKTLKTHVPVHLEGVAPGIREGGILEHRLHELEVECLPKDLPEDIVIDISGLSIGNTIHVSEIETPEGVKILDMDDNVIVTISHKKAEEVVEEEEEEEGLLGEEELGEEGAEEAPETEEE